MLGYLAFQVVYHGVIIGLRGFQVYWGTVGSTFYSGILKEGPGRRRGGIADLRLPKPRPPLVCPELKVQVALAWTTLAKSIHGFPGCHPVTSRFASDEAYEIRFQSNYS